MVAVRSRTPFQQSVTLKMKSRQKTSERDYKTVHCMHTDIYPNVTCMRFTIRTVNKSLLLSGNLVSPDFVIFIEFLSYFCNYLTNKKY